MGRVSLVTTGILLLANVHGFTLETSRSAQRVSELNMVGDEPAGSFFHQVPDDDDNEESNEKSSSSESSVPNIDDAFSELLRQRKKPSRASKPSTINGVPTARATGFGKSTPKAKSSKPYVAIGPTGVEDKPINDPTKPEFDDQGYTLYTDQETGEKSRVFEALVEYPCTFKMKIIGANEGTFVPEMVALVAEACESKPEDIPHTTRAMGKWISVTVQAPVKSSEMLYSLYEKVDQDPRVKFKF